MTLFLLLTTLAALTVAQEGGKVKGDIPVPTCDQNTPFYLVKPHTYLYHLEVDEEMKMLTRTDFPLIDDEWFRDRWQDESGPTDNAFKWAERTVEGESSSPPVHKGSWNHVPKTLPKVLDKDIAKFLQEGIKFVQIMQDLNILFYELGIEELSGTASGVHQHKLTYTVSEATNQAHVGYAMGTATKSLAKSLGMESTEDLQLIEEPRICEEFGKLPEKILCKPTDTYRSFDGSCNNLKRPTWGQALTPFRRMFIPNYGDGVSSPRLSKKKTALPNAREVSLKMKKFPRVMSDCFNTFQMSFGQFIDHDLTATPTVKGMNGSAITCCDDRVQQDPSLLHPECYPITISSEDPLYQVYGSTCQNFLRSLPAKRCYYGPREQINQLTAYIDGSALYGSSKKQADSLRTFEGGLLKTHVSQEGEVLLPIIKEEEEGCNKDEHMDKGQYCFRSGDFRVNEHILLTLLTTMFAREHNRIAKELSRRWPYLKDQTLYQETKRIITAELQHITYNEFLPGLLGPRLAKDLGLIPLTDSNYFQNYNEKTNAGIANEFAAAAYRMGHSMVPEYFFTKKPADDYSGGVYHAQPLNDVIFHPFHMYNEGGMADVIHGALAQGISDVDPAFSGEITGKLFKMGHGHGLDLVALNVQRGRDHGIVGYVEARQGCGYPQIRTFEDLNKVFDADVTDMLKELYDDVEDIDLFVGGMAEKAIVGGLVGPTFGCILTDQFLRTKEGDRFWYENIGQPGSFTPDQLASLHKVSLMKVFCDNFPELGRLQRWPLQLYGAQNPIIPCNSKCLPELDLSLWSNIKNK